MYSLYRLLVTLGLLFAAPYLLLQRIRRGKIVGNIPERLGLRFPRELRSQPGAGSKTVWIHSVSVGELLAAEPLARALKGRHADLRLVVSTTTETGQALARQRWPFADAVFYFPLDLPGAMRRVFAVVRPDLALIMETEIWPNFLRMARERGAAVVYANGRISDRTYRGFKRWVPPGFRRHVLEQASLYLMQSEQDAKRAIELGAPRERVLVTGNLKYDAAIPAQTPFVAWLERELKQAGRSPLLVAGSVLAGEEQDILHAFAAVAETYPQSLLLIAPRKPEWFSEAAAIIEKAGWPVVRRSTLAVQNGAAAGILKNCPGAPASVLLLDSLGELASVYEIADAVFVGGSLVPAGGHNPLEPAVFGKAPVFGFSMENFQEISEQFLSAGAAIQVRSRPDLASAWLRILGDREASARMGRKAREVVERHRGATAATLARLGEFLDPARRARS